MGTPLRVCVLGSVAEPGAARLGRLLGVTVLERGRALLRYRPQVVLVRLPVGELGRAALLTTLAGASAVIAVPIGPARPLPWWARRYHRFLLASQAEARAWGDAGIALGRLVVVEPASDAEERHALEALVHEVAAMALGPDIRRRAR